MRYRSIIFIVITTLSSLFTGCKNPDLDIDSFKIERERVVPSVEGVSITGSYSFAGTVKGMKVNIGEKESLIDAVSYEMQLEGTEFSVTVENLKPSTEYYYRYTVDFGMNDVLMTETKLFTTQEAVTEVPTVKIYQYPLFNEDSTFVRVKCEVVADGGSAITERGIFWNNLGDPVEGDSIMQHANGGLGIYTISMDHLSLGKTYYVRAYAKNAAGVGLSDDILEIKTNAQVGTSVSIELSCNPTNGGTVSGGGTYVVGSQCTVTAEANPGYTFVNWTENGNQVSSQVSYTFPVTSSRNLVANFTSQQYTIFTEVVPENSGTVTGAGGYNYGNECTLTATPKNGYDFVKWTKGGSTVSINAEYSFVVTDSATYKAHFKIKSYTVNVLADPNNGGTVDGSGTFDYGHSCTVRATPVLGYLFVHWTADGDVVSTEADYTFTVTGDRTLVAHFAAFQVEEYTITAMAEPIEGGMVTGGGTYNQGESCTVAAIPNTGYHFHSWNENGIIVSTDASYTFTVNGDRELVANFELNNYTISVSANPTNGGIVTGGGTYCYGAPCIVQATANTGYTFEKWMENGSVVSNNVYYSFVVTDDRNLVAHFTQQSGSVDFAAWVAISVVMEDGNSPEGTMVTLLNHDPQAQQSYPVAPVILDETGCYLWDEICVGNYQVTVTKIGYETIVDEVGIWEDNFVLSYTMSPVANTLQGAINGRFTINSSGDQVYFSQGNLQYQASTSTWRFAENQFDFIGEANENISSSYSGWIDLFGWGTSGWNCGNTYYRPWDSDASSGTLYGPPGEYNLIGSYANSDWGYYSLISNGGNTNNIWHTLTRDEWVYVFNTRSTSSGIRYAKAQVNNVNGVILLPDNWSGSYFSLSNTNTGGASYTSNVINTSTWMNSFQTYGAVFLPTAGYRYGTSIHSVGSWGYYWSASYDNSNDAYDVGFASEGIGTSTANDRYYGFSVRLVCPAR